jgi:hypothetical protein
MTIEKIPLVDVGDVKSGRGGGKRGKGERYPKYVNALARHVDWIKEEIEKSKDGHIRIRTADLAKNMEMRLKTNRGPGLHPTSFYWGVKYAAFHEGLAVVTGQTKGGESILAFRLAIEEDELPPSLAKGDVSSEESEATAKKEEV